MKKIYTVVEDIYKLMETKDADSSVDWQRKETG